ncbi:MAG: (d)CMP kinase [Planctomycetes bacterium]|nr:(d)CMP kinase [Planctomycetota bacterium]
MAQVKPLDGISVVTLDGLSGSGKSTLAKLLAKRLNWFYVDSGAWYRALTWAVLQGEALVDDTDYVLQVLSQIELTSDSSGVVSVNNKHLLVELRTPQIDKNVSAIADHLPVREALNQKMRAMLKDDDVQGVVADGRDAGTIIFANAPLKVFVEVPLEIRAARRFSQQRLLNPDLTLSQVQAAIAQRDNRDAQRGNSAPHPTDESYILDNSNQSVEQAVGRLLTWHQQIFVAK